MASVPEVEQLAAEISAGSPLERLAAANTTAGTLRSLGDQLLDQFVDEARSHGLSWSDIGDVLGTSKQAAQQRFAALDPPPQRTMRGLTGPVADVLDAAGDEARALGHHYVRPEHLILGLLSQPEELAAITLRELGITPEPVRERIAADFGRWDPRPNGSLGVAPQVKRLLEHSRAIAKALCHNSCPRTEHILLAAISPKLHSSAATLLARCGAEPTVVHDRLTRAMLTQSPELAASMHRSLRLSRLWKSRS
jgi:hypothetical protein